MSKTSYLFDMLGIDLPIVQAPAGAAASAELVSAVGRAGGIGGLALTWNQPGDAVAKVRAVKARVGPRFFVNYVLRFPPTSLDAVLAEGVSTVTLSWGIDPGLIGKVRSTGAKVGVQVGHPEGGRLAAEAGATFIIAQGCEAGGHVQSTMPLETLLAGLHETVGDLPIVAAGGLSTAGCVRRVLDQGAAAAMLGTRFVATHEANAHEAYKQALVNAKASDTAYTNCFDIGWPNSTMRVLRNSTLVAWEAAGCPDAPHRPGEGETIARQGSYDVLRYSFSQPYADAVGEPLAAVLYAGISVDGIDSIMPAFDLVRSLTQQSLRP